MQHSCPGRQLRWDVFESSHSDVTRVCWSFSASALLSHHCGPTWDQSMAGLTPGFLKPQIHSHLLEKEALMSPIPGESPGPGYRQCCLLGFPPSWHLPWGEVLPGQPCPAPGSSSAPICSWDTSQGFPAAWHGHSAVACESLAQGQILATPAPPALPQPALTAHVYLGLICAAAEKPLRRSC